MALLALVLAGPRRGINSVTLSTHLLMPTACEDRLRKPNDLEGVVACPPVVTAAAAGMVLPEVGMVLAQVGEDMAHQAAEEAMGHLQTEEVMGHRHVATAGL